MSILGKPANFVLDFIKKRSGILIYLALLLAVMVGFDYYTEYKKEEALKDQGKHYQVHKGDALYEIKGKRLENVTNIIVVSPSTYSSKVVFVKEKNSKQIDIYENISTESFNLYNKTSLEPYVKDSSTIDFRSMNSMKDIHERLGVPEDPKVVALPQSEIGGSGWVGSLLNLLLMVLLLWAFIHFNGRKLSSQADIALPEDINDNLNDLVGMEDIKAELLQLEDMILNKELYSSYNINKKFNIMMSGPAGVGKTKIARCLAKRLDVPLIYASASSLQSGYVGGGARALKNLQKQASKFERAIVFLDEAESLLLSRMSNGVKDYERETITALLAILDGVDTNNSEIIWIVASNMDEHKVAMDDAMLRRFPLKINFRMPNFEERKEIMERLISKMDVKFVDAHLDLKKMAGVTANMSPAILETIVSRASLIAIQESSSVNQDILMRAFERVAVGLTDRETTENMEEKRLLVARHEAGHFIMQVHEAMAKSKGDTSKLHEHINVIKISTESVSKMGALGFVLSKQEELNLVSLNDYENQIKQLYGGMANEEIYYGATGVTAGAHNDIQKVSSLLKVMIGEVGYYQNPKLNYAVLNSGQDLSNHQIELIEKTSTRLFNETKELLEKHTMLTDLIVSCLMAQYVINIDEALAMVDIYFTDSEYLENYRNVA